MIGLWWAEREDAEETEREVDVAAEAAHVTTEETAAAVPAAGEEAEKQTVYKAQSAMPFFFRNLVCAVWIGYGAAVLAALYSLYTTAQCGPGTTHCVANLFQSIDKVDIHFYASEFQSTDFSSLSHITSFRDISFHGLQSLDNIVELNMSETAHHAHIILVKAGNSPDRAEENSAHHLHIGAPLSKHVCAVREDESCAPRISCELCTTQLRSELSLYLVNDVSSYPLHEMPAGASLKVSEASYIEHGRRYGTFLYKPVFAFDEMAIVEYVQYEGPSQLRVKIRSVPLFYHRLSSMVLQWYKEQGVPEAFVDEVRYSAANWFPFALLGLCLLLQALLAMLHTQQSASPESTQLPQYRLLSSLVLVMYVCNSSNASAVVLVSLLVSFLIELLRSWSALTSVVQDPHQPCTPQPGGLQTMWLLLAPLTVGISLYSIKTHTTEWSLISWWTVLLHSAATIIYARGFCMMTLPLWVNWQLRSVPPLSTSAFLYRLLCTIQDDIFALLLDMPTAHRVACFRDDVIFVLYMLQRQCYRVDLSRKY
jgi:hypothetical protein